MPVRTLGPEGGGGGVDCDVLHWLGGKQTTILKPCGESPKKIQYLLAVDLGRYKMRLSYKKIEIDSYRYNLEQYVADIFGRIMFK